MTFHGATPLGTSAGSGEAVHLVDASFEGAEYLEVVDRHAGLLQAVEPGVFAFRSGVSRAQVESTGDETLLELFRRASRYGGKGCLHAVDNVHEFAAPRFEGSDVARWNLRDIDRALLGLELDTARRRGKLGAGATASEEIAVMQRKQNLGMNAILSISLALARGVAHVRGQELWELLREELLVIITRLAAAHGVAIQGSRFSGYLDVLREVAARIEARGASLHEALREVTGIYRPGTAQAAAAPSALSAPGLAARPPTSPSGPPAAAPPAAEPPFTEAELEKIAVLDRALAEAYGPGGSIDKHGKALRCYLETMAFMGRRYRMFEIANHRMFRDGERLLVPYDAHGRLSIHAVRQEAAGAVVDVVAELRLPHGTLVTDALVAKLCGARGEAIDLELEIYHLDIDDMPAVQVSRLRDLAALLRRLNDSGSRHEAVYLLRFAVARLCSTSYRGIASAKNLGPEITRLRSELTEFLNGPFAYRLRLPSRILVRSISGLVSQPKLIDEVWQDTIDLSEVHVRGSAIANEIRRSTHHALGKQTLALARAYLRWLQGGAALFPDPERERLAAADEAARSNPAVLQLVARIVANLEQLLGSSQLAARIAEWRRIYADELLRCESGNSLDEELESLVANGIRAGNSWVYQHRLRSLGSKARAAAWAGPLRADFEAALAALQAPLPSAPGFQAETAERHARAAVEAFSRGIRRDHQQALFGALDELLQRYQGGAYFAAFEFCCTTRHRAVELVGDGVFESQRYLLHQLDCVLEELGYFALRHVASNYQDHGVDLQQCLRIVHLCAGNLERDGLFSRELLDLSAMLVNPARRASELLDVLGQVQRNYHRLVLRVSEAYEVMAAHLGYSAIEMRGVLANFQRTMHDLNSLVHFSDIARAWVAEHAAQLQDLGEGSAGDGPWDFVHLSHGDDIRQRVEQADTVSLQARYGGKGSGLLYISYLGIPTRDAFIIPTVLPRMGLHRDQAQRLDSELLRHVRILAEDIERNTGKALRLGDPAAPLLLAVRGGSVFSMPGMLTTVVFVGMTETVAAALAREDEWYAWDACRRFLASYAAAVWRLDLEQFDLVEEAKRRHGVTLKTDLPGSAMREVVEASKAVIREAGHGAELDAILADAELQLKNAMRAVHASWDGERARRYRAIKHLSEGWHTAVIVQQMASGNRSNEEELRPGMDEMRISLTGVIPHTRMTASGFRAFTGDVKFSACGDDLVGGLTAARSFEPVQELHAQAPMLERKLKHISARLRRFLGSDAEIEFTVERGVLSILQTRSAQRELHFNPCTFVDPGEPAGRGIGIAGGAFRGVVAFDEDGVTRARAQLADGTVEADGVLLVLENPIPDEIPLILSVDGLLAARGGSTSHAAVAVHGIDDKPFAAVLGVAGLHVSRNEAVLVGARGGSAHRIDSGDVLSIHGQSGEVFLGPRPMVAVQTEETRAERHAVPYWQESEPSHSTTATQARPRPQLRHGRHGGTIIGLGILRTPGEIARTVQDPWLYMALWAGGGVFVLLSTLVIAELMALTPKSGGPYALIANAYGPYPGFLLGWTDWLGNCASSALKAVVLLEYAALLLPELRPYIVPGALMVNSSFALLQLGGVRLSGGVFQVAAALFGLILLTVSAALLFGHGVPAPAAAEAGNVIRSGPTWAHYGIVVAAIVFTYDGWVGASYYSAEVAGGARSTAIGAVRGVSIVIVLYLLLNVLLVANVPLAALDGQELALAGALDYLYGSGSGTFIILAALFILLDHQNALYMSTSRALYALSADGLGSRRAAAVSERGTPTGAVVVCWIAQSLLIVVGGFEFLLNMATLLFIVGYVAMVVGVFRMRRRRPEAERPFRAPGFPLSGVVCAVCWVAIAAFVGLMNLESSAWSLGLAAVSVPVFLWLKRRRSL